MIRALLLVAREIALAHDRWLSQLARRRPLAAENAALRETVERLRAQIDLLRARLLRLHPRRRPRYRPWERLAILWHRARYGLSVSATRLSDLRGRRGDPEYRRRRMADPALREAETIRNTARWRAVRKIKLAQDPLCQDCIEHDRVEPATQVHHREPLVRRPDLAFTMENLRSLCTTCHARREAAERVE